MTVAKPAVARIVLLFVAIALLLAAVPVSASETFPKILPLPDGWQPEGIATGRGTDFFAGSLANGAIWKGDLRTGEGFILSPGEAGRITVGLKVDLRTNYVIAAGGPTGKAYVFDGSTGAKLAEYQLAPAGSFINDVVITRDAAYFTQSNAAFFYKMPLGPGGQLPDASDIEAIALSGDWQQFPGFNANGIEASANGKVLIIVNSTLGQLFAVDPDTGVAKAIDLGGESVTAGDGILLEGKTLYVVRNRLNKIAVIDLNLKQHTGALVGEITDPAFRVPTTVAQFGSWLYAVNARFGTPPTPQTEYEAVRVDK